jgi:hypothetical protein
MAILIDFLLYLELDIDVLYLLFRFNLVSELELFKLELIFPLVLSLIAISFIY